MDRNEIKFLLTHSSIYGLGTVVSQAVSFFMLPLYTRFLTPKDYGILELIDVTTMLTGLIFTLGISAGMSRFYYEDESPRYRNAVVGTTYLCYFGISLLLFPPLLLLSPVFAKVVLSGEGLADFFVISFLSLFLGGVTDIGLMYLRLIKKPIWFSFVTVTRLTLSVGLNILFVAFFKWGIMGILLSSLIGRGVYAIIMTGVILMGTRLKFSWPLARELLKFTLPLIPSLFAGTLIKQSDKYFVRYLVSISETGIYGLALKMGSAIHYLLTVPFLTAFIPRRFEIINRKEAPLVFRDVFRQYSFVFIFCGLALSILTPEIFKVMVTEKFRAAGKYVPLVILSLFILGCQHQFDLGLYYSKKTKFIAYIDILAALLQLPMNFFFIRMFGLWGAILSSLATLTVQASLYLSFSRRYYQVDYNLITILKALSLSIGLYLLSILIASGNIAVDFTIKMVILVSFLPMGAMLRIVSKEEIEIVKEVTRRVVRKWRGLLKRALGPA